jgi:hypothetical protein
VHRAQPKSDQVLDQAFSKFDLQSLGQELLRHVEDQQRARNDAEYAELAHKLIEVVM